MDHGKYDNDLQQNANNNYARCPLPPIGKLQSPVQNIETNGRAAEGGEGGAVGTPHKGNSYLKMYSATSQFKALGNSNHQQLQQQQAVNSHESPRDGQQQKQEDENVDLKEEPTDSTSNGDDGDRKINSEVGDCVETDDNAGNTEKPEGSLVSSMKDKESIYDWSYDEPEETNHETKHLQQQNNDDDYPYQCLHCEKSFTSASHLKSHFRTHTGEKPHRCLKCPRAFSEQSSLKRHMRLHSGERPYVCAHCSDAFCNQTSLTNHLAKHTGDKPHKCDQCKKSFIHASHLKSHIRTHTGEKPFVCIECDRSFSEQTSLRRHMRIHTDEKPYVCAECDKAFHNKSSLKYHIARHYSKQKQDRMSASYGVADDGENPTGKKSKKSANSNSAAKKGEFKCNKCPKICSTEAILKRHCKLHSGDPPFKCTQCEKGFFRQVGLQQHKRTHSGEKPYLCEHCDKKFSQHSGLKRHLRNHTGVQQHQCPHCEKSFWCSKERCI